MPLYVGRLLDRAEQVGGLTAASSPTSPPSPERIFSEVNAFHRSAALKAGTELDLFTAIGEGYDTTTSLAKRCQAAERGVRILSDYLVTLGFLGKNGGKYVLTAESAAFLDRRSAMYMGSMPRFLMGAHQTRMFQELTAAVRHGGTALGDDDLMAPENPDWVEFARSMTPLTAMPARSTAERAKSRGLRPRRVLDIAAGSGLYGIEIARAFPYAEVVAVDWPNVLEVARENARQAGISDRYRVIPGSAFDVEFGKGYDLVLLPNFLHHFDAGACTEFLRKVADSLDKGGSAVAVEFVPNDDRVSPTLPAQFALIMLAETKGGDAYTASEYRRMFTDAGFRQIEFEAVPPSPQHLVWAGR